MFSSSFIFFFFFPNVLKWVYMDERVKVKYGLHQMKQHVKFGSAMLNFYNVFKI